MDEDEIFVLGTFCEGLLSSEPFNVLVKNAELSAFQHIMTTKDHETKLRESIFMKHCGVREFIESLVQLAHRKREIEETALSPKKDAQEDID